MPRLRAALLNSTGGTGKASDVNFARLQAELDEISQENILKFSTPPFFTIIIRSLTILEGMALSVDPKFRLVRGAYPYVLRQLLSPEDSDERTPAALQKLLIRLLTVNGEGNYNLTFRGRHLDDTCPLLFLHSVLVFFREGNRMGSLTRFLDVGSKGI